MRTLFDPRYRRIIDQVKKARRENGLSQSDVAGRLSCSRQRVSLVETYQRRLDICELLDMAAACGLRSKAFIGAICEMGGSDG